MGSEAPATVRVLQGPTPLRAGIEPQWGGHTFSYLLEGRHGVPLTLAPLAGTRAAELGLDSILSLFVPTVLQGSVVHPGRRAMAIDASLTCREAIRLPQRRLLWWLERCGE